MEETSSNPMFVDEGDYSDDLDTQLYGYLNLRVAVMSFKAAILNYTQEMQAFDPDSGCVGDDVQLILDRGSRMLYLADKVCNRADVVEECIEKDIKDARQALDLAKQVLRHCRRGPFNPDQPSPEMFEDVEFMLLLR